MLTTSNNALIASLVLCASVVGAKVAQAEGFHFGGGAGNNGNSKSSFKINFDGNGGSQNKLKNGSPFKSYLDLHKDNYNDKHCHIRYIKPVRPVYSQCYHPRFCCNYVYPGDTWYSISKRAYGVGFLSKQIAAYNGLPINSMLVPGQMLRLPVVNANGSLSASNAPMPAPYTPHGPGFAPLQTYAATTNVGSKSSVTPANGEPTLSRIITGSTLLLDGKSFGVDKGSVRLRIGGLALPVEVIEWTTSSAKIELPKMELASPVKASLEVLRADGSLASKSEIELAPAATRLALGN